MDVIFRFGADGYYEVEYSGVTLAELAEYRKGVLTEAERQLMEAVEQMIVAGSEPPE